MLKLDDEPESPNEGACLGYMFNRNRQTRGMFKIYEAPAPASPNQGPSL